MTKRFSVRWPDPRPFVGRDGPIRILAASDALEPTLEHAHNREQMGRIDLVVGCGDLEPDWLGFLADSFRAPLQYVRGNHDRGLGWHAANVHVPDAMPDAGLVKESGLRLFGLNWPGEPAGRAERDEGAARIQALLLWWRARRSRQPVIVVSHVPPAGMGDGPDPYHAGFAGYRWVVERLRPPLWLHGHTTVDGSAPWNCRHEDTALVNVTGAVLIELQPPDSTEQQGASGGASARET